MTKKMQGFFLQRDDQDPTITILKDTLTSAILATREYCGMFKLTFESHINVNKIHLKMMPQGDDGATPIFALLTPEPINNCIYLATLDLTGAYKDNIGHINGCPIEIEYFG